MVASERSIRSLSSKRPWMTKGAKCVSSGEPYSSVGLHAQVREFKSCGAVSEKGATTVNASRSMVMYAPSTASLGAVHLMG